MKTIVTHRGQAHRDEFLACCLLLAAGKADCICRLDPLDADFNDPDVIVLDQGEVHDPERLNFDHHQFDRDADPACSITLILPYLGIDVEQARKICSANSWTARAPSLRRRSWGQTQMPCSQGSARSRPPFCGGSRRCVRFPLITARPSGASCIASGVKGSITLER